MSEKQPDLFSEEQKINDFSELERTLNSVFDSLSPCLQQYLINWIFSDRIDKPNRSNFITTAIAEYDNLSFLLMKVSVLDFVRNKLQAVEKICKEERTHNFSPVMQNMFLSMIPPKREHQNSAVNFLCFFEKNNTNLKKLETLMPKYVRAIIDKNPEPGSQNNISNSDALAA